MDRMTTPYFVALLYSLKYVVSIEDYNITLYEVIAFNPRERALLYSIHVTEEDVIFLNGVTNEAAMPMDVIVQGNNVEKFENMLLAANVQYTYIPHERVTILENKRIKGLQYSFLNSFLDWQGIEEWISIKLKKHNSILDKITFAISSEKRPLYMLKLSIGKKKPGVFIMGGEQGSDWMSPVLILNFLNTMLDNQKEKLLKKFDFYLLPVVNPDGYEYSMTEDRFWARNRKVFFPEKICKGGRVAVGVNVERNWYMSTTTSVTAESECNSIFVGHKSTSEEETRTLSHVLDRLAVRLMAFINVRSFERLITIPYAYKKSPTKNHDLMMELMSYITEKLEEDYNITYYFGNTASFFYNMTGCSADWVKEKLNVPIVFTAFMKHTEVFLPLESDIEPLTDQFVTIMNDTLLLADDIYGPLFNNRVRIHYCSIITTFLITLIILIV